MVNPTGYTALDLVGFTDKGPYSSSATYVKNDLVHYEYSIWRCLVDDTTNVTPAGSSPAWAIFIVGEGEMAGATSSAAGLAGLVPGPAAGDQGKFLRGDATWNNPPLPPDMTGATTSANGTHGLVPAPLIADKDGFLKGDGSWSNPTAAPMTGATASVDGTGGSVPGPLMGDQNKVFTGAGTYVDSVVKDRCLVINKTGITGTGSSVTTTITDAAIEADMVVVNSVLSNPAAQTGDWTVNTYAGYLTVAGTINDTTNLTMYLMKSR